MPEESASELSGEYLGRGTHLFWSLCARFCT